MAQLSTLNPHVATQMPQFDSVPTINYSAIKFPSDRVNIANLRRAHPERFDVKDASRFGDGWSAPEYHLNTILYLEHQFAEDAFERALGQMDKDRFALIGRKQALKDLTIFYQSYGIAKGAKHTAELVRDIERQATDQASRHR